MKRFHLGRLLFKCNAGKEKGIPVMDIFRHLFCMMFSDRRNKKRRGRSRYLLSVSVDVEKDGESIPAKPVYVRNKGSRKDYLVLISTDTELVEEEIIRIYGKRWNIEVFFKACKSYLNLVKKYRGISYDAMNAHVSIGFSRYMMLSVAQRK